MSNFKRKLSTFAALLTVASFTSLQVMALDASDVISKTSNINSLKGGSNFVIDMNANAGKGAVAQIDWQTYNIPKDQTVKYGFSNASQTVINRVLGGETSYILGKMISGCSQGVSCGDAVSTSKVLLINPAGVLFGQGSSIDLNSFTVSTKDVNGLKNLKNVSNLTDYQKTLNNTAKNVQFVGGKTPGTVWFDTATVSADKAIGVVADNIVYKNSVLKTAAGDSRIKLVTADGVTFAYDDKGLMNLESKSAGKNSTSIFLDNSGLGTKTAISSNNVELTQASNTAKDSYIYTKDTVIKGTKLATDSNGDVVIRGTNDVNVIKTTVDAAGNATIQSNSNAQVFNSSNITAGATATVNGKDAYFNGSTMKGKDATITASDKTFVYGNAKVEASNIANVGAAGQLLIADSQVSGKNGSNAYSQNSNAFISNSKLNSQSGNAIVQADKGAAQIYNKSAVTAGNTAGVKSITTFVNNAQMTGKNVVVEGINQAYVNNNAKLTADDTATVNGANVTYLADAMIDGKQTANVLSSKGSVYVSNASVKSTSGNVNVIANNGDAYLYNNATVNAATTAGVQGKETYVAGATVQGKDVIVNALDKTYVYSNAKVDATNNTSIGAADQLYIADSTVNGQKGASIVSSNGNTYVNKSNITSKSGAVNVAATNGSSVLYNESVLSAGTNSSVVGKEAYINNATVNGGTVAVNGNSSATVYNATLNSNGTLGIKSNGQVYTNNVKLNSNSGNTIVESGTNAFLYNTEITNKAKTNFKANGGIYTNNAKVNGKTISLRGAKTAQY